MATAYIPGDVKCLKYAEQVSWAAGDPGSGYASIRAFDIDFKPTVNMIQPGYQKAVVGVGPDAAIAAGEGGTLTFKTHLRGGAGSESLFSVLASNMGLTRAANADVSSDVKSATSSTMIMETSSCPYEVGDLLLVNSGSTDSQVRYVSRYQANTPAGDTTLDIEPDWTDNPQASDDLYAMDSFTPGPWGEPTKYMTFHLFYGSGTYKHRFALTGCAGTFAIASTGPNALPVIEWTYQVDAWASSETDTTQSADSFNPANPLLGDPFFVDDTQTRVRSFGFDPGLKLVPLESTDGTHGRQGWLYTGDEPKVSVEMYWDQAQFAVWQANTTMQLCFTSIKDTDEAWGFFAPAAQYLDVGTGMAGDHHGMSPEFLLTDPGLNADSTQQPKWVIGITGSGT